MVAAAQCAHAARSFVKMDMFRTKKLLQGEAKSLAVGRTPDGGAAGNLFPDDGVQPLIFDFLPAEKGAGHAASDIDAHKSRKNPVLQSHGEPDGAGLSRVHIRHNPDAAFCRAFLIADHLHLRQGVVVYGICEDFRRSVNAVYLFHEVPFRQTGERALSERKNTPARAQRQLVKDGILKKIREFILSNSVLCQYMNV